MNGTIIQQGRFISTGEVTEIQIRSDVDWMETINFSVASFAQTTAVGVQYYWQRGMDPASGVEYKKSNAANATDLVQVMPVGGFTLLDTSGSPITPLNSTITSISNAPIPVVTNTGFNELVAGDIVRIVNVLGGQQLGGFDFTVGNNTLTSTSFSLDYMSTIVATTTGGWRRIKFDPQFYPRRRYATQMNSQSSNTVIQLSVTHGFTVGQAVRLVVPAIYGMVEMDKLIGNITQISTVSNTILVDIDSSSFTPFAWPLTAEVPFTPALVVPLGETANQTFANNLDDATDNQSFIGMQLGAGADSPAGLVDEEIYWRAGKSFSVDNN